MVLLQSLLLLYYDEHLSWMTLLIRFFFSCVNVLQMRWNQRCSSLFYYLLIDSATADWWWCTHRQTDKFWAIGKFHPSRNGSLWHVYVLYNVACNLCSTFFSTKCVIRKSVEASQSKVADAMAVLCKLANLPEWRRFWDTGEKRVP